MSPTPWYILGAGAIGCLWASYWRLMGVEVILITPTARKGNQLVLSCYADKDNDEVINSWQLDIQSTTTNQLATSNRVIQQLLICTKAQDTLTAIQKIKPNIDSDATILLLQNGMAVTDVAALLKKQSLAIGITTDGAYRTAELKVMHAGRGFTYLGSYQQAFDTKSLLEKLPLNYLDIRPCNNIEAKQWQKLAINCAINGLTAIFQCRNGELLKNPEAMSTIKKLCYEISEVSKALKFIDNDFSTLFQQVKITLQHTTDNFSSMYQDIKNGRTTEIDFINGYLCQQAEKKSIPCPENKNIITLVKNLSHH